MDTLAFFSNEQLIELSKNMPWFLVSAGLAFAIWRVVKWAGNKGNSLYELLFNHEDGKFIEMVDTQKDFVQSVRDNNVAIREDVLMTLESIRNIERKLAQLSKVGFENLNSDYFSVLFEHSPLPILFADSEYNIISANTKFVELLGYTNDELQAKSVADITKEVDIELGKNQSLQMVEGDIDYYRIEKSYERKNGTSVYCVVHVYRIPTEGPFDHFIKVVVPK
jgi:PAS domain S-box-containing protein